MGAGARRAGFVAAAVGIAAASAWTAVHLTSSAVRRWRPSSVSPVRKAALASRLAGSGELVVVLISGLAASERYWGADYDLLAEKATLLVVDPLGFGGSAGLHDVGDLAHPATHVRMLEATLAEQGLSGRPLVVVGHSMGASLALRWAATSDAVRAVVCFGAPLYRDDAEVQRQMAALGWFESLLARGPLAEAVCHWMCRNRGIARRAAVILSPRLPTAIARDAIRHTWDGYIGAFTALIADADWQTAMAALDERQIPVTLVEGADDAVPVAGRANRLASHSATVRAVTLEGDHHLPMTRPDRCLSVIDAVVDQVHEVGRGYTLHIPPGGIGAVRP